MDAFHEVLAKIHEDTGGSERKAVNFIDITKRLGLYGNYLAIYERLTTEGWVVEDPQPDCVRITPFGVKELKKYQSRQENGEKYAQLVKEANRSASVAREMVAVLEAFAAQAEPEKFPTVTQKLAELQSAVNQIKANLP
jgi:hypothetical protein